MVVRARSQLSRSARFAISPLGSSPRIEVDCISASLGYCSCLGGRFGNGGGERQFEGRWTLNVRRLINMRKVQTADTTWRDDDMPPRNCPIFSRSRPTRAGWRWRSARAKANGREFVLVALTNVRRGDLKATLMIETPAGYSVVGRYEFHASHPGLHLHAHCDRGGVETGPSGLDDLTRIPPADRRHSRVVPLSVSTFWDEARRFFRIDDDLGPLFAA